MGKKITITTEIPENVDIYKDKYAAFLYIYDDDRDIKHILAINKKNIKEE